MTRQAKRKIPITLVDLKPQEISPPMMRDLGQAWRELRLLRAENVSLRDAKAELARQRALTADLFYGASEPGE